MDNLQFKQAPMAKTGMLIRRPIVDVFESFINPDITTKFWFTKSSGRLEVGKQVQWDWEMYAISIPVTAKAIEPNKHIVIEWGNYDSATTVEWAFTRYGNDATYVSITNSGFKGDADKVVGDALDSKGGFTAAPAYPGDTGDEVADENFPCQPSIPSALADSGNAARNLSFVNRWKVGSNETYNTRSLLTMKKLVQRFEGAGTWTYATTHLTVKRNLVQKGESE